MQGVGKKKIDNDPQSADIAWKRKWLVSKRQCCGVCPMLRCARDCTSLLSAVVVCDAMDCDSISPVEKCDTFAALTPEHFRGIDSMLLEAAENRGIELPAGLLAA